ncbi:MAG: hypothetical protein OHK0021_12900 [Bryobacter sp.]
MFRRTLLALGAALPLAQKLAAQAAAPPKTHLKVGDMAPDFTIPNTAGREPFTLSSFRGKSGVVVAFFPAAFTGG